MAACPPVLLEGAVGDQLLREAQLAVAALLEEGGSEDEEGDDPQSLCSTWWVPLARGESGHVLAAPARHAIEQTVGHLCALPSVVAALGRDKELLGAEWWLQEQCPGDAPKELHTDKDVFLERSPDGASACARTLHPWRSSVLYLSETGGPTAVFDQRRVDGRLVPPVPPAIHVAFPWPGRFLVFDGELLHGVLHPTAPQQEPTAEAPRRTLLVNWWAERPSGARARAPRRLPPAGPEPGRPAAPPRPARLEPAPRACAFWEDAPLWRRQQLPPALRWEQPPPQLSVLYPAALPDAGAAGAAWAAVARGAGETDDWMEEEAPPSA